MKIPFNSSRQFLFTLFRMLLGAIFIFASYGKILDPGGFATIISNYQVLPENAVNITAVILPWVEMCAGLALVFGLYVQGAALLVNLMMMIFITLFAYNWYRGLDISCGCFSLTAEKNGNLVLDMMRDMAILSTGIWVMLFRLKETIKTAGR